MWNSHLVTFLCLLLGCESALLRPRHKEHCRGHNIMGVILLVPYVPHLHILQICRLRPHSRMHDCYLPSTIRCDSNLCHAGWPVHCLIDLNTMCSMIQPHVICHTLCAQSGIGHQQHAKMAYVTLHTTQLTISRMLLACDSAWHHSAGQAGALEGPHVQRTSQVGQGQGPHHMSIWLLLQLRCRSRRAATRCLSWHLPVCLIFAVQMLNRLDCIPHLPTP